MPERSLERFNESNYLFINEYGLNFPYTTKIKINKNKINRDSDHFIPSYEVFPLAEHSVFCLKDSLFSV